MKLKLEAVLIIFLFILSLSNKLHAQAQYDQVDALGNPIAIPHDDSLSPFPLFILSWGNNIVSPTGSDRVNISVVAGFPLDGCSSPLTVPPSSSLSVQAYYSGKFVLFKSTNQNSPCLASTKGYLAELVGAGGSFIFGYGDSISDGSPNFAPTFIISPDDGAALLNVLARYNYTKEIVVTVPATGGIKNTDLNVMQEIARSMNIDQHKQNIHISSPRIQDWSLVLAYNSSDWRTDPCLNRVRGTWCIGGHLIMVSLVDEARTSFVTSVNNYLSPDLFSPSSTPVLSTIDLSFASILAPMPISLFDIQTLTTCNLGGNQFTGELPTTFAALNISSFSLTTSHITTVPAIFSQLKQLVSVDLSGNSLSLPLSYWFLNFPQLNLLFLDSNPLNQSIPETISNADSLLAFSCVSCALTGSIPSNISSLPLLTYLDLSFNFLQGTIPNDFGASSYYDLGVGIEYLSLSDNKLTGTIPAALFNIPTLQILQMTSNDFFGSIPGNLCGMSSNLMTLEVGYNPLSGSIPRNLSNCPYFQWLEASNTQLSGTIPDFFNSLPYLQHFSVFNAQLTGTIPASLGLLPFLTGVLLSSNQLTGTVPSFMNATSLQDLYINSNNFTGGFPSFSGHPSIQTVKVGFNSFTTIPIDSFDGALQLTTISMPNALSSSLSLTTTTTHQLPHLINCPMLANIDFASNAFTGRIPNTWQLPALTSVNLRHNTLTQSGGIDALAGSNKLQNVDLSFNQISLPNADGTNNDLAAFLERFPSSVTTLTMESNLLALPLDPSNGFRKCHFMQLILSHNQIPSVSYELFLYLSNLTVLDLSFNSLTGDFLPPDISVVPLMTILNMEGNPSLVMNSNPPVFPPWLIPSGQYVKTTLTQSYSCQSLASTTGTLSISVDPTFYSYSLCACDAGTFGISPSCTHIPDSVSSSQSTMVTDAVYGDQRLSTGMDSTFVLTPNIDPSHASRTAVALLVNLTLYPSLFRSNHDVIQVYSFGAELNGTLVASFVGSKYQIQRVNSDQEEATVTESILVLAPQATIAFRTKDKKGRHFDATYQVLYECPLGYYWNQPAAACQIVFPIFIVSFGLQTVVYVVSVIVSAVVCSVLCYVLWHRDTKVIRQSALPFCVLILVALLVMSAGSVFYALQPGGAEEENANSDSGSDSSNRAIGSGVCHARVWMTATSVVSVLSFLLTKANRIRTIFLSQSLSSVMRITNKDLVVIASIMLLPQFLLLITLSSIPLTSSQLSMGSGLTQGYRVYQCATDNNYQVWMIVQFVYVALLLFIALILAWKVRKVPSAYNESSHIVNCIYVLLSLGLILVVVQFLVQNDPNSLMIIRGVGQSFVALSMTLALFAPKIYTIFDGRGNEEHALTFGSDDFRRGSDAPRKSPSPPVLRQASDISNKAASSGGGSLQGPTASSLSLSDRSMASRGPVKLSLSPRQPLPHPHFQFQFQPQSLSQFTSSANSSPSHLSSSSASSSPTSAPAPAPAHLSASASAPALPSPSSSSSSFLLPPLCLPLHRAPSQHAEVSDRNSIVRLSIQVPDDES